MRRSAATSAWVMSLLVWSSSAFAEVDSKAGAKTDPKTVDSGRRADILRLLQLTQAGAMGEQAVQYLFATYKQSMPQVKDELWQELKKEISADELLQRLVPVYEKHFSASDIKELIRFYESPVGKKLTVTLPSVNQEALGIGQTWGSEIAVRVKRRLDAQSPAPAPATKK